VGIVMLPRDLRAYAPRVSVSDHFNLSSLSDATTLRLFATGSGSRAALQDEAQATSRYALDAVEPLKPLDEAAPRPVHAPETIGAIGESI